MHTRKKKKKRREHSAGNRFSRAAAQSIRFVPPTHSAHTHARERDPPSTTPEPPLLLPFLGKFPFPLIFNHGDCIVFFLSFSPTVLYLLLYSFHSGISLCGPCLLTRFLSIFETVVHDVNGHPFSTRYDQLHPI